MGRRGAVAAWAALVALGMALACDPTEEPTYEGWTVETWSCEEAAAAYDIPAADRDTLCALAEAVRGATVYEETKTALLGCLPGLSAPYRENLLEQVQTSSATALGDLLTQMTADYHICGADAAGAGSGCNSD